MSRDASADGTGRIPGLSYILPIRRNRIEDISELTSYLRWLAKRVEVVVVDGSPPAAFAHHHEQWPEVTHVQPLPELRSANGKAWGVNSGLQLVSSERVIIADDDVRYDDDALHRVHALLATHDIVRPQNYFDPVPWHAAWDSGRILLNRALDRDWPGTLAVRRTLLMEVGGYAGDVLFENLELWRTVEAADGRTLAPLDLYVRRMPPHAGHFWSQRVRQAYDEFARPRVLLTELALLPLVLTLLSMRRFRALAALAALVAAVAESGRQRAGGTRYFPAVASVLAPVWLMERAVCVWLAAASRLRYGGVRYSGGVLRTAATPRATLRRRVASGRAARQASR